MKHRLHIFSLILTALLCSASLWATINNNTPTSAANLKSTYYTGANNKSGSALFSALSTISTGVTYSYNKLTYDNLWTAYITSDVYPTGHAHAGKIWDMYANCYYSTSDHVSQMKAECNGGYNREHSLPKSWFGGSNNYESTNQGCDLVHLVPTDAYVNSDRGNYAFGEVGTVAKQFEISKRGTSVTSLSVSESTLSGTSVSVTGSPTVFEPSDEYKGDFARIYMYMRVRYSSLNLAQADGGTIHFSSTTSAASATNYGLTNYSVILLMKWHRQDPVSQKEIDRNNAIEKMQGNRNPFVDYPCLAEYLWGKNAGETFLLSNAVGSFEDSFVVGSSDGCACSTDPTLTVNPTSLTVDPVAVNGTSTKTFTVTGVNLTGSISITKTSGSNFFTVSPSSVTAANANGSNTITVTYAPTATGNHTATFTITSSGATKTVTVSGTCTTVYNVTWRADDGSNPYHSNTAASGSKPTLPSENPDDCSTSRVFMGWTDDSDYSGDGSDLFTDSEDAPPITSATTFYAVYADATTSGSGSVSTTVSMSSFTSVSGNVDGDSNVSYAAAQGDAGTAPVVNSSQIRIYQNGGLLTITANNGKKLTSITIGSAMTTTVTYAVDGGSASSNQSITAGNTFTLNSINATSVVFTCTGTDKNSRLYLNNLSVTYSGSGSVTTYSNYSTQCTASSCTLSNITLNTSSVQKSFAVGDAFNYTGLIVTANYSDCVSKTVTPTSVSSPDMSTTGNKTVTVSYTESGTTKTATYTITVETAPEYTVTFMNMGGTHATRTGTAGSAISAVSNPTACTGYTFEGWSTSQYAVDNTTTPSLSTPTTIPVGGATYYAVYSKTEGSGGSGDPVVTYEKVTTAPSNWAGNYLIVYETESKVFNGLSSTGSYVTTTISDGVIAHTDVLEACEVVIAKMTGDNYSIQMNSSATNNASKYLSGTSGSNKMNFDNSASANTIELSSGDVTITSNTSVWRFNNASSNGDMFRYYKSTSYSNQQPIQIYVRTETGGGSSTTYHTTAPDCCTATITATSNDENMGTVDVTLP